jgi:hypothetical protein
MATAEQDQQDQRTRHEGPNELFKYSAWVHVGQGAEDCEEARDGHCGNPLHFHAWCRLPNQLQHEDIRERALAAKARRIRQLRDPEADAYEILESDMSELRASATRACSSTSSSTRTGGSARSTRWRTIEDSEEFKTIDRDRERLGELRVLDPDPSQGRVRGARAPRQQVHGGDRGAPRELEAPIRESLEALTRESSSTRSARSASAPRPTTPSWSPTRAGSGWPAPSPATRPVDRQRTFSDVDQLVEAAPEVLDALQRTFSELEASLQRGPKGN